MELAKILNRLKHVVLVLIGIPLVVLGMTMFVVVLPLSPIWWILSGKNLLKIWDDFLMEKVARKTMMRRQ